MKSLQRISEHGFWAVIVVGLGFSSLASASLESRAGGTMYYDTVLDITWLADANYAFTSGAHTANGGAMDWDTANTWAQGLRVGGYTGWRLPKVSPVDGGSTFNYSYSPDGSTDMGYNITSVHDEMSHLYYVALGNIGDANVFDSPTGCGRGPVNPCLANTDHFSNVKVDSYYWTGNEATGADPAFAIYFDNGIGYQDTASKALDGEGGGLGYAWAVHDGDIGGVSAVPLPPSAWLFTGALAGLGLMRRTAGVH